MLLQTGLQELKTITLEDDSSMQAKSAWHLLRGQLDKIVQLTENEEIR